MEHKHTVEVDGTELEVTYDDEADEMHARKSDTQLTEEAMGYNDDSFEAVKDNIVGRSKDMSPAALQQYAEQNDETYSRVHLTAKYLLDVVERIEWDCRDSFSAVTLHVVEDATMLLTAQTAEYGYVVAPRVEE